MKIRTGFVSNSSSSSFCIFGVTVEKTDIKRIVEAHAAEIRSFVEDRRGLPFEVVGRGDVEQLRYLLAPEPRLEFYDVFDTYFIGKSWSEVGDDETGAQFRERVTARLKAIGLDMKPSTMEEAWYNG